MAKIFSMVLLLVIGFTIAESSYIIKSELIKDADDRQSIEQDHQESSLLHKIGRDRPLRQVHVISRNRFDANNPPILISNGEGTDKNWQGAPQPLMFGQAAPAAKSNNWSGVAQPVQYPQILPPGYPGGPPRIGAKGGANEQYIYQAFAAPQMQPRFGTPFGNPQWQPVPNFGG